MSEASLLKSNRSTISLIDIRDQAVAIYQYQEPQAQQPTNLAVSFEPGFSLILSDQIICGQRALKQSRYNRSHAFNHYWYLLNHNALAPINPQVRHQADLVWHQLKQWQSDYQLEDIVIAYPSHYSTQQCQILGGICNALGLNVIALFNRALLAVSSQIMAHQSASSSEIWHLDIQWHQSVACQIHINTEQYFVNNKKLFPESGIGSLIERLFTAIRQHCIEQSRFDIEHDAHIEQQVFDQIPQLLNSAFEQVGSGSQTLIADPSSQFIDLQLSRETDTFSTKLPTSLLFKQVGLWSKPLLTAIETSTATWYRDDSTFLSTLILPQLTLLPTEPNWNRPKELLNWLTDDQKQAQWVTHWPVQASANHIADD